MKRPSNGPVILIGVVVAFLIVASAAFGIYSFNTVRTTEVVVTDKERVCSVEDGADTCKYLVFTDKGTFENTDSLFRGKFNSSDVQGSIEIGARCTFTASGFRIPIFSQYPNILEAECNVDPT